MDAYSSLSKYDADNRACVISLLVLLLASSPHIFFLPPAKKQRVQPGCILLLERLWSQATGKLQVNHQDGFISLCRRAWLSRSCVGKKGDKLRKDPWKTKEGARGGGSFRCSRATTSSAKQNHTHRHTHRPSISPPPLRLVPPPGQFATDFLKLPSRSHGHRYEPMFGSDPRSDI